MAKRFLSVLAAVLAAASIATSSAKDAGEIAVHSFDVASPSEILVTFQGSCAGCAWGRPGHETAALRVALDGKYSQHVLLIRGETAAAYRISLGALAKGKHTVQFDVDRTWTPPAVTQIQVREIKTEAVAATDPRYQFLAHAPILCARPNTIRKFTDAPLIEWVETDARASGKRLRYSVIFTNEDGGTVADRLLATWGRLTDIEYVYSVDFDASGAPGLEEIQAKDHIIRKFAGEREGAHPLIRVVTDNNMVSDEGACEVRYTIVPKPFDLTNVSREVVMDEDPWTYRVSSEEARREGRVVEGSKPGDKTIVDPRRYVYLEACAPAKDAGLTFAVGVQTKDGLEFHESNDAAGKYLIQREPDTFPTGCFRGAVSLPAGTTESDVRAIRFFAHTRPPRKDETPLPKGTGSATLTRVNKMFLLGPDDLPRPSFFKWTGEMKMTGEGPAVELKIGG